VLYILVVRTKEMTYMTMNLSHFIIIKRLHKGTTSICLSSGKETNTEKKRKTCSSSNHKSIGGLKSQIKLDGGVRPRGGSKSFIWVPRF